MALAEKDEFVSNVRGIKFDSAFNALKYFHVVNAGLPPCLGHDIFEGVVTYDVALILKNLIKEKRWLTYDILNHRLTTFHYLGTDARSKPCQVNVSGDKLGGQAVQNWSLIRLLPVIVHDKIKNPDDAVWQQFLVLHDIVEIICAPEINESEIAYLSILIDEYLEQRKSNFPNDSLKPKHHYLHHYPRLILEFGPLIRVWTMRFESKHSYFKQCIRSAQNFKNICQTMSEKHQLLQAYKQTSSFFQNAVEVKKSIPLMLETYNVAIQSAMKTCQLLENAEVSMEVTIKGTLYKKGKYVVLGKGEHGLLFGEIHFMIVTSSQVYFMVQEQQSEFSELLHVYILHESTLNSPYKCVEHNTLSDYYPLSAYRRGQSLMIALKHAVPVSL